MTAGPTWRCCTGPFDSTAGLDVEDLRSEGQGAVLPASCEAHLHGDLALVPVPDAPLVTTVIALPPHSRSRVVAGLVPAATRP